MDRDEGLPGPEPSLTVVVPAHQAEPFLDRVFSGLVEGGFDLSETILVDDGSSDATAEVAHRAGVRVIRNDNPLGASAARNRGASEVRTDLVCFVDADVVVHPNTRTAIVSAFRADPELTALFGSYDADPSAQGFVSRYRNLLHHFVHQTSGGEIGTFWSGFGTVKAQTFNDLGGFDSSTENVEDVDFGMRLNAAGYKAVLDPSILSTHLKHWSLPNMLKVDIFGRAIPWTRLLMFRHGFTSQLNTTGHHRLSVVIVGLLGFCLLFAPLMPELLSVAGLLVCGFVLINLRFFRFLWKTGGPALASVSVFLHILHYGCAGVGFGWVLLRDYLPSRLFRTRNPATAR